MQTILIIESEPANLVALALILRSLGYSVLEAGSPAEAVSACQESPDPIHLVVTEAVLDHTNSGELVAQLRASYPQMGALVIADDAADDLADISINGCAYLTKPFQVEALAAGVQALLGEAQRPVAVAPTSAVTAIQRIWRKTASARHVQAWIPASLTPFGALSPRMRASFKWSCLAALVVIAPIVLLSTRGRPVPMPRRVVDPGSLALTLTGEGERLHLRWDGAAPAIRLGRCGVLWIADGSIQRRITLSVSEMRTGSLFYWPNTKDVSVGLNIADVSTRCVEPGSILSSLSITQPVEYPVRSKRPARTSDFSQSHNARSGAQLHETGPDPPKPVDDSADRVSPTLSSVVVSPAKSPDAVQPSPSPRQQAIQEPLAVVASVRPASEATPEPFSTVTMEAETQSHERGLRPLLRKLRSEPEFEPPMPLHESTPMVSDDLRRHMKSEVPLDVRVYVNKSGKVDYAELLSDITDANRSLASVAVFDARHWEFTPARSGKRTVPGRAILHYRFGHPVLAMSNDLK